MTFNCQKCKSFTRCTCNIFAIPGPRGPQGPAGPAGTMGNVGPQGLQGPAGPVGPAGTMGNIGPQGLQGLQGPVGPTGTMGNVGPQGPAGPQGTRGNVGLTGPQGPTGPQGLQGPAGLAGTMGNVGPVGPQGLQGPAGLTGTMGNTGPQGPAGPAGSSSIIQWNVSSDNTKDYLSDNNAYYYISTETRVLSNGNGPTTSNGKDLLISTGYHPFFVPSSIKIKWVSSMVSQNLVGDNYNIQLYYTNPISSGNLYPILVNSTTINSAIQPGYNTITINGPFNGPPAANAQSSWSIVIDPTIGTAKNFSLSGIIQFTGGDS